jgi:hypothetical protein
MSLKAIEMQIAIPRTYDAGKIQEQQDHKGQNMYYAAAQSLMNEEERKRMTVMKGEHKANISNKKQRDRNNNESSDKRINGEVKELKKNDHPYKGNVIDYSG